MPSTATAPLRVGLVGCGRFARFSAEQYRRTHGVTIGAVADIDPVAARRAGDELLAPAIDPAEILVTPDVDLVYIATPPAMHFDQARSALLAGRHVLVEKPMAMTGADAAQLADLATRNARLCVANLVERYNPLIDSLKTIIESRLLGDLVHGLFMNDAADEGLGRQHWFWNRKISGGIFVEHGVHFFDLVSFLLGEGQVVSAARSLRRPVDEGGDAVEEQVMCTCRYAGGPRGQCQGEQQWGVLFHFEHGFHQPSRLDRQELRLVFERGEMRLFDWVFTHGVLEGLFDEAVAERLASLLPGSTMESVDTYAGEERRMRGRFKPFEASMLGRITFTTGLDKLEVYARTVHDLFADQVAWIQDPSHARRLTEADSVASVAMACEADRLALQAG